MIDHIPMELVEDIQHSECLPIIGAGFSLNALVPQNCRMPLWNDLGIEVADRLGEQFSGDALKTMTKYCKKPGKRYDLIKLLRRRLFICISRPGEAHLEFAKLPFPQVLTTNFDFLLERAYDIEGKSYFPIVDADLLSFGQPDGETRIIKMHGDLHHPSLMVVTQDDYDVFIEVKRDMFLEVTRLLQHNSLLFIGYSLNDPDFQQIWKLAKGHLKLQRNAYALVVGATEEQADEYEDKGVTDVISLPGSGCSYGHILADTFRQIRNAITTPKSNK